MAERIEQVGTIRVNSGRVGGRTEIERVELYVKFAELYDKGMSDLQIALEAGSCDRTVRRWRYREQLPNIYGKMKDNA